MEFFENKFYEGLNQDSDVRLVKNTQYLDAENITVVADGEFGSISVLPGTVEVTSVGAPTVPLDITPFTDINILKIVYTEILTSRGIEDGLLVFSYGEVSPTVDRFEVRALTFDFVSVALSTLLTNRFQKYHVINENVLMYSKDFDLNVFGIDIRRESIDTINFQEQNTPVVYFTNGTEPMKRIVCDITSPILPYSENQVLAATSIKPDLPTMTLADSATTMVGGNTITSNNVLTGSYQAAVRYLNSDTNVTTKWSLLTEPLAATKDITVSSLSTTQGYPGETSDKKLYVTVNVAAAISSEYDRFQVAIVENTTGTGIPKLTANVSAPQTLSTGDNYYFYSNGEFESQIDISDITVEDAAVISSNTLSIKNSRLIQGGLRYRDFDFDNGDPDVVDANTSIDENSFSSTPLDYAADDDVAGIRGGYFRGEVYRYGVVYHDEFGNWSPVKVLDMSGVSDNEATTGSIDFKFPEIQDRPIFNGSGEAVRLGLNIEVENHPSWARGMAIVRAKRVKDIQFQTPVVSTRFIGAPYASNEYPQSGFPTANADAQVGNVLGTLAPKDFSDLYPTSFVQDSIFGSAMEFTQANVTYGIPETNPGNRARVSGVSATRHVHVIFNPNNLYNFNSATYEPYSFQDNDQLDIVDACYLEGEYRVLDSYSSDYFIGTDVEASEACAFIEVTTDRYYFSTGQPTLESRDIVEPDYLIKEYQDVVFAQDSVILGKSPDSHLTGTFGDYASLDAPGLSEGTTPINQPMSVIVTDKILEDPVYFFNDQQIVSNDKSIRYTLNGSSVDNGTITNDPVFGVVPSEYQSFQENATAERQSVRRRTGVVHIANVKRGLSDFRYGDQDASHEFVFTGGYTALTEAEITANTPKSFTIAGGDCFISAHTFKIADSTYFGAGEYNDLRLIQQDAADKYGLSFRLAGGSSVIEYSRPIPMRTKSQTLTVFLESEIDARSVSHNEYGVRVDLNNLSAPFPSGTGEAKIPFSYEYNLDYSLPNNNQVFFPALRDSENNNDFFSRVIFSDPKIYNTRDNGLSKFRVGNILDLDEGYGSINKLQLVSDKLMCWQDEATTYLPTDSRVLEQSDVSSLSVRTDNFLDVPVYVSNTVGSRSVNTFALNDTGVYFVDDINRKVYNLTFNNGFALTDVSALGNSSAFEHLLSNQSVKPYALSGVFDFEKDEYLLFVCGGVAEDVLNFLVPKAYVFSERIGGWVTKVNLGGVNTTDRIAGVYSPFGLHLSEDDNHIHQANIRNDATFLGNAATPYVRFAVNPAANVSKVYDVFTVDANRTPQQASIYTSYTLGDVGASEFREFTEQTSMNVADITERENTFRIPILRTSGGARVRGNYAVGEIQFNPAVTDEGPDTDGRDILNSVITHYRPSERKV